MEKIPIVSACPILEPVARVLRFALKAFVISASAVAVYLMIAFLLYCPLDILARKLKLEYYIFRHRNISVVWGSVGVQIEP